MYIKMRVQFFLRFIIFVLIISCSSEQDKTSQITTFSGTGDIALKFIWKDAYHVQMNSKMTYSSALVFNSDGTIDCEKSDAHEIYVGVFDPVDNKELFNNQPGWKCSDHKGKIVNIPVGDGYKIVCRAKNSAGNVILFGEKENLTVTGGKVEPVEMEMTPFKYEQTDCLENRIDGSELPLLECNPVTMADKYELQIAEDTEFGSIVISDVSEANSFFPQDFKGSGTYYWRVRLIDAYGVTGAWMQPKTIQISHVIPVIEFAAPSDNAVNVDENTTIEVTFSAEMDSSTFDDSTFVVNDGAENIAGNIECNGKFAQFQPENPWQTDRNYTVTITNGVSDIMGNHLMSNYTWAFSTTNTLPAERLTVLETNPENNASQVNILSNITATFSDPINESTLTSETFRVNDGIGDIAGSLMYDQATQTATFTPNVHLTAETPYTVEISGVEDSTGEMSGANYISRFTTYINEYVNSFGMEFRFIYPGTFFMGSPADYIPPDYVAGRELYHIVTLTQPFYMQATELTHGQWAGVVRRAEIEGHLPPGELNIRPSHFDACGDNCPVESVTWNHVQRFITALNQLREGIYMLPTEAQWEYSAKAETTFPFYFGECLSTEQANYNGNDPMPECELGEYREGPIAVKTFLPNKWGLYDMHGNVKEMCYDWDISYTHESVTDPVLVTDIHVSHVLRGGDWYNGANECRSSYRGGPGSSIPEFRSDQMTGFRLVRLP